MISFTKIQLQVSVACLYKCKNLSKLDMLNSPAFKTWSNILCMILYCLDFKSIKAKNVQS